MKRGLCKVLVALGAHLVFWGWSVDEADAQVVRWRTNGTECRHQIHNTTGNFAYQGATVKAGTVECRQTTCLFENFHADESTVLPLRPLLTRKVYGQLRAQGYECAMAQHPWTHPDGSVVERNYFMFRR